VSIPLENIFIRAISHDIRREILKLLKNEDLLFTELLNFFDISSGKLTYHLNQIKGFIEKSTETNGRYRITPLGIKALDILQKINNEITEKDQPLLKEAFVSQKNSSKPLILQGINISIGIITFFISLHVLIAIIALPDPQTPIFIIPLMLVIFLGEFLILIWLIKIKKASPVFLERISKHLSDTE
jgi:predicted transcriptional regulator